MDWNIVHDRIESKSLLKHDFYTAWSRGELNHDDLRFYAKQYYALETALPKLLARILSRCENQEVIQCVLKNLNDEALGEENHRELWLRFAEGLGLTREEVINTPKQPATEACIEALMTMSDDVNPVVGLSMLFRYEGENHKVMAQKLEDLRQKYQITDPHALSFFNVHKDLDVWHAEQEQKAIMTLGGTLKEVLSAVDKTSDALYTFLDGVDASTRLIRSPAYH